MLDRSRTFSRFVFFGSFCAALLAISSCTGTYQSAGSPTSTVTMSAMTPSAVTLMTDQSQQFNASVTGASNTSIVWSLSGNNSGGLGTVSSSGLYKAPQSVDGQGVVITVNAAAEANTSVSTYSQITVIPTPPPVSVTINPSSATVTTSSTQQFTATVTDATDKSVTWGLQVNGQAITGSSYGTITSSGLTTALYTAPASVPSPANITVVATSSQDHNKSAGATVTIVAAGAESLSISPSTADIVPGTCYIPGSSTCQTFTATVLGLQDQAVSWAVSCSQSQCGSVTLTGADTATYTAPDSPNLNVTLTATSVADTSLHNTSVITVVGPQLIVTCASCNSTTPIYEYPSTNPPSTATLQGEVMNVPPSWTVAISWPYPQSTFCITTHDDSDSDDSDRCGTNDNDGDGPGKVTDNQNGTYSSQTYIDDATYTAPMDVSTSGTATDVGCNANNGGDTDAAKPWVYVPVQAVLTDANGVTQLTLTGSVCLRVGGTQY